MAEQRIYTIEVTQVRRATIGVLASSEKEALSLIQDDAWAETVDDRLATKSFTYDITKVTPEEKRYAYDIFPSE